MAAHLKYFERHLLIVRTNCRINAALFFLIRFNFMDLSATEIKNIFVALESISLYNPLLPEYYTK